MAAHVYEWVHPRVPRHPEGTRRGHAPSGAWRSRRATRQAAAQPFVPATGSLLLGAVPSHDASPTVEARHDTRNHHPSPDVARSAGPQAWRRWPGARRLTRRPRAAQRGSGRSDVMGSVWPRVEGVAECVLTRWTAARSSFQGSHRCVSRRPDRRAQPGGSAPAVGGARRRSSARSASWAWRSATSATLWPCEVQRATIDCASSSTPSIPRRSSSR